MERKCFDYLEGKVPSLKGKTVKQLNAVEDVLCSIAWIVDNEGYGTLGAGKKAIDCVLALTGLNVTDRTELNWFRSVIAQEMGVDAPGGEASHPLRDWLRGLNTANELLKEGVAGFGRLLISTSDDAAVRDWQKRCRAYLIPDGQCKSCVDDRCTAGPECVATSNPIPPDRVAAMVCNYSNRVMEEADGNLDAAEVTLLLNDFARELSGLTPLDRRGAWPLDPRRTGERDPRAVDAKDRRKYRG